MVRASWAVLEAHRGIARRARLRAFHHTHGSRDMRAKALYQDEPDEPEQPDGGDGDGDKSEGDGDGE